MKRLILLFLLLVTSSFAKTNVAVTVDKATKIVTYPFGLIVTNQITLSNQTVNVPKLLVVQGIDLVSGGDERSAAVYVMEAVSNSTAFIIMKPSSDGSQTNGLVISSDGTDTADPSFIIGTIVITNGVRSQADRMAFYVGGTSDGKISHGGHTTPFGWNTMVGGSDGRPAVSVQQRLAHSNTDSFVMSQVESGVHASMNLGGVRIIADPNFSGTLTNFIFQTVMQQSGNSYSNNLVSIKQHPTVGTRATVGLMNTNGAVGLVYDPIFQSLFLGTNTDISDLGVAGASPLQVYNNGPVIVPFKSASTSAAGLTYYAGTAGWGTFIDGNGNFSGDVNAYVLQDRNTGSISFQVTKATGKVTLPFGLNATSFPSNTAPTAILSGAFTNGGNFFTSNNVSWFLTNSSTARINLYVNYQYLQKSNNIAVGYIISNSLIGLVLTNTVTESNTLAAVTAITNNVIGYERIPIGPGGFIMFSNVFTSPNTSFVNSIKAVLE